MPFYRMGQGNIKKSPWRDGRKRVQNESQEWKVITIETNCRVHKEAVNGVELIIEGYPELKLGAHYIQPNYTITELNSGTMLFSCSEKENYLQKVIDSIDPLVQIMRTDYYLKQVERLKIIPFKSE